MLYIQGEASKRHGSRDSSPSQPITSTLLQYALLDGADRIIIIFSSLSGQQDRLLLARTRYVLIFTLHISFYIKNLKTPD